MANTWASASLYMQLVTTSANTTNRIDFAIYHIKNTLILWINSYANTLVVASTEEYNKNIRNAGAKMSNSWSVCSIDVESSLSCIQYLRVLRRSFYGGISATFGYGQTESYRRLLSAWRSLLRTTRSALRWGFVIRLKWWAKRPSERAGIPPTAWGIVWKTELTRTFSNCIMNTCLIQLESPPRINHCQQSLDLAWSVWLAHER